MIESIHFQGVDYTPEAFAEFQLSHPEAFLPTSPVRPSRQSSTLFPPLWHGAFSR